MELAQFLVKAKNNSYASEGESGEIVRDGGKEFIFEESKWTYRDRYFGFNPFIGEEIVLMDGKIVWGMNYYGRVVSKEVNVGLVYEFLKKSMRQVNAEKPFRGPDYFKEEDWEYENNNKGTVNNFEGIEIITLKGEKVYELKYSGGLIIE